MWQTVRVVKPRLALEGAGKRTRAEERLSSSCRDSDFGNLLLFTHKISDSEVREQLGSEKTLRRAGWRLTAYEFSGNTRANARVLSAATRG